MTKNRPQGTESAVTAYKVVTRSGGRIEIQVTSGELTGKSARVIPVSPAGAYFNLPKDKSQ